MTTFEEKQKKVNDILSCYTIPSDCLPEEIPSAADIIKLYNKTIRGLLYYTDYYSNPTEKSKYMFHRGLTDVLTHIMTVIVGEFEITTKIEKANPEDPDDAISKELLEKIDTHRVRTTKDLKVHTLIKTEVDKYFTDEIYKADELFSVMLTPAVYSQFALVKFVLKYIGFFNAIDQLSKVLYMLKCFLETPLVYEVLFDDKIKSDINSKFGDFVTEEVKKKYKEEAKMNGNLPKENHTTNINLYQVSSSSIDSGFTKYPVIIAAADLQEALYTFKKEFLDESYTDPDYYARNIDAICKIGECFAVSDTAFEKIKNDLK